jgi:glycosyltransferase involved in cell wall biosynthesis
MGPPMRVLLTTHAFLPRSIAGVEVYTWRLARALQQLGHAVTVLTAVHDLGAAPHAVRKTKLGTLDIVEIVNPHLEGTLASTYCVPGIDRAIREVLEQVRPDCVHVQHLLNLSTGLLPSPGSLAAPVVLTLHDYWLSCPRDGLRSRVDGTICVEVDHGICAACLAASSPYLVSPIQRMASRAARLAGLGRALHVVRDRAPSLSAWLMTSARRLRPVRAAGLDRAMDARAEHLRARVQSADAILAPTRFAAGRALEWGIPAGRLEVMSLGAVDGPTRARPAGRRRRFGFVGTVAPHKGVHVLIEAFRGLADQEATLDVIGNADLDPAYAASLRELAGGDARIRFRRAVPADEQERVWSSLDLLVLPSLWWENSPLTVLEALAAGVAVVASRIGGVPELLPERAGVLVPPGDTAALRDVLLGVREGRLLAGPLAPLPLKTAVEGARELTALYSALLTARGGGR